MLFKYFVFPFLSLFILTPALAKDNWSFAEIPYDKASSHIVTDNETLWVATAGGGVYRYDNEKNTYQHFTRVNDGISHNIIYDMVLDRQKNLWLATHEGLNVYKNDTWHTFTSENTPELKSHFITALAVDPVDNTLWVGTYDTGLYRYDGKQWQHYDIPYLSTDYTFITSISVDLHGELWVGVWGDGAYHFADGVWTKYDPSNSPLLSYFAYVKEIENNGTVWFWAESYGLVEFEQQTNTWNVYLKDQTIHSVHKDKNGNVWAQSLTMLYKKQGKNFIPVKAINSDITGFPHLHLLDSDPEGRLIVGTNTGFQIKNQHGDWKEYNPPGLWDTHINDLIIDDTNTKWIATRVGLHKITSDKKITLYNETNSDLPSSYINGLTTDKDGALWIATKAGLVTYDGKKWKIFTTENSGLISNVINDVNLTDDGTVWVSFSNYAAGVQRFDGKKWQHFTTEQGLSTNSINEIHIRKDEIWLQSGQGISIFKDNKWHTLTIADGLLSNNVTSIALMKKHAWIGTDQGLIKYDGKNFEYIVDDLPGLYVSAIYEDPENNLFIGIRDVGLSLYTQNKQWEHKNWDDGLTHTRISQIVPDADQQLWLGTEYAIGITQRE